MFSIPHRRTRRVLYYEREILGSTLGFNMQNETVEGFPQYIMSPLIHLSRHKQSRRQILNAVILDLIQNIQNNCARFYK